MVKQCKAFPGEATSQRFRSSRNTTIVTRNPAVGMLRISSTHYTVFNTVESSVYCQNAISSLQWHVNAYKSPSDIKEDVLAKKAKDAYEKCEIVMTNLNALKVGTQITEINQKTLMSNLQFGLDYLKGSSGMKPIVNKIHEYSSNLLVELNKLQTGKMFTEEKKKELKGYVQSLINNLKETDFENKNELAIVERIMELKELS
ncbi:hypothetical protein DdX_20238 [Ditylenchus destructor]|uniref:Uncharacterized protein n=1 Tax=Ditylenchus destructor TaxID=166010 RepID=A0AAD4MGY6_9BILA|nr:hypothetical protein DdX_20238 [Ditylenchus destructor]